MTGEITYQGSLDALTRGTEDGLKLYLNIIATLITALSTLAPERRGEIVALGMKSWLAGNFATMMTGAIVGLLMF